jgi:hypothetical protein
MRLPSNYQYLQLSDDDREALYQQWCRHAGLDPSLEYSIEEFFSKIDGVQEATVIE